ncbi:unnamed protein product [Lathyrus sativus]|nr:unnamed protein product [Lathyrus sativus]
MNFKEYMWLFKLEFEAYVCTTFFCVLLFIAAWLGVKHEVACSWHLGAQNVVRHDWKDVHTTCFSNGPNCD